MVLNLNKNNFVSWILNPATKLTEHLSLSFETKEDLNYVKTLTNSSDNSVIFLGKAPIKGNHFKPLIIPDCKTFLRLLANIEEENLSLNVDTNSISYEGKSINFKYHLLDESYFSNKKSISESKVNELKFDTSFLLTKTKLNEILKFNTIIPEAEKVYFFTKDSKIFAKIGDEQKTNTNHIVIEVGACSNKTVVDQNIPLNIQNLLLFSFTEEQIDVQLNTQLKIFKFSNANTSYVVSALVK